MDARRLGILGIILLGVVLGAVREFLFHNLNYQLDFVQHDRVISFAHSLFQGWVVGWNARELLLLKWTLALFFAATMCALCIALARILFHDHRYGWIIPLAFLVIGIAATGLHALGSRVEAFEGISIQLLHLLQYPVILLFIWAAASLKARHQ